MRFPSDIPFRGPIGHFSLEFFVGHNQQSCLQPFLDLIFQKGGLRNLSFRCGGFVPLVQLLSFNALKDLYLHYVRISLPGDFGGFHQLTSLKLHVVCISQPDIQSLIDGSKKLTSIELSFNRIMSPKDAVFNGQPVTLTFNCPLLKYLSFDFGEEYSVQPKMIYAPCLDSVKVTASTETETDSPLEELVWIGSAPLKFMADIAHISQLSLNFNFLMFLFQVDLPHTLRAHFQQLRCLKLIGQLCYMHQKMFKVLCCLLRSMPSLESLELQCHEPWKVEEAQGLSEFYLIPLNECKKKEDGYLCLDQTLRTVAISMENLSSLEDIIWIMHFILVNANVLELIKITYSNDNKIKSRLHENLCKVEKASADAHVVFVNSSS